jgi:protein translocase SecG subunit
MISIIYILVTVALVTLILLQQRSAGMSGLFGGDSGGFYQARRGLERFFFGSTVVLAVVFVALSIWQLLHR